VLAAISNPGLGGSVTEVPEHLLQRSQDRRAALGLGGGDAGGAAPSASASTEVETTASAAPAAAAAAAPVPEVVKEPEPVPAYVQASLDRKRIPIWAMPVLAFLPVWAVIYAQTLSQPPKTELSQLDLGAQIYSQCAGCHGGSGGGGAGRPLADGAVLQTFPNIANQLEFIRKGSAGFSGGYGNPDREGGQHVSGETGAQMPTFSALTDAELLEVTRHERETLSGEEGDFEVDAEGNRLWPNGEPMLDSSGALVWDDGEPMFDADGNLTKDVDASQKPAAG
jgi:mono/diheme cytochrome c family protein